MNFSLIKKYLFFLLLSGLISMSFTGCKLSEPLENKTKLTSEEKAVIKMQNKENVELRKEYDKAIKAHWKNQQDNTKQMMKDAKKQQRRNNRIHQRSFWERLFGNNCNK
jgi:hypoxanthine phosphoribosyltransferase